MDNRNMSDRTKEIIRKHQEYWATKAEQEAMTPAQENAALTKSPLTAEVDRLVTEKLAAMDPNRQLTRAELQGMTAKEITEARKAGRLSNIMEGK